MNLKENLSIKYIYNINSPNFNNNQWVVLKLL